MLDTTYRVQHSTQEEAPVGYDLRHAHLRWHPPALGAARDLGLTQEEVEVIARSPQHITIDPSSSYREWYTERRRTGDVTVVVTFPPDRAPRIWGVYIHLPLPSGQKHRTAGGGNVLSRPKTMRELRKRIAAHPGLKITPGGHHDRVIDLEGKTVTTLPSTPSDHHSVANTAAAIARKGYEL